MDDKEYDVYISTRTKGRESALRLVPRVCVVGIDPVKGATAESIDEAVDAALKKGSISPLAIKCVASIRTSRNEQGILDYCRKNRLPLELYSAEELKNAHLKGGMSNFKKNTQGVINVAERSALLACDGGTVVTTKLMGGTSVSIAMKEPELSF